VKLMNTERAANKKMAAEKAAKEAAKEAADKVAKEAANAREKEEFKVMYASGWGQGGQQGF